MFAAMVLVGCEESNVRRVDKEVTIRAGVSKNVYEWTYKGHTYLIIGDGNSGFSATHAGHCSCGGR